MSVVKQKPKEFLQLVTKGTENKMNESQIEANTSNKC